jgi:predicted metal-dependent hydrolase
MQRKRPRALIQIGEEEVSLSGNQVKYLLKQSTRSIGYRLEIRHDSGLTVVVPKKFSRKYVDELLHKKEKWILRHLPGSKPVQLSLFKKEADQGDKIPFMGGKLEICRISGNGKRPVVELQGTRLLVSGYDEARGISQILERWYRQQASPVFTAKADAFQLSMGVRYREILIRGQRSRWGSCSHKGNLTFNWKLLMAPEQVIDYVIVHELAHLKHMNHSKNFWEMVARFCPKWKGHRKWLLAHEQELKSAASFAV